MSSSRFRTSEKEERFDLSKGSPEGEIGQISGAVAAAGDRQQVPVGLFSSGRLGETAVCITTFDPPRLIYAPERRVQHWLLHYLVILSIKGNSCRMKERRQTADGEN